ncbi:programmed cell death protein 2 [Euwallacea similis]|uniref:programmed cell death protein 2 n=1 Tax=Euwallacea similis TaxID=1736056 RepID=UPI00344BCB1A
MPVSIGLLEKCPSSKLQSSFFPSKVGGKPAWLSLDPLPSYSDLSCAQCKKVTIFLCQVYAPFEHTPCEQLQRDENFHRTLFVFVCRNSACSSPDIKVFRSALARTNDFYPFSPVEDAVSLVDVCNLCGISAHQRCGQCKKVIYCCKEHQVIDWKSGHKQQCKLGVNSESSGEFLFPEWELLNDFESKEEDHKDEAIVKDINIGSLADVSESDLEPFASKTRDKTFSKFKEKTANDPYQVIRYERGGQPLLIAENPIPSHIPNCEYCGCTRIFEFQIMPQMLYELNEKHLDWGVLLIYTCKDSCKGDSINSYKREFVFQQNVAE